MEVHADACIVTGLACGICYEAFHPTDTVPCVLACGHSFCATCLSAHPCTADVCLACPQPLHPVDPCGNAYSLLHLAHKHVHEQREGCTTPWLAEQQARPRSGTTHEGGSLACGFCRHAALICSDPGVEIIESNIATRHANLALVDALRLLRGVHAGGATDAAGVAAQVATWLEQLDGKAASEQQSQLHVRLDEELQGCQRRGLSDVFALGFAHSLLDVSNVLSLDAHTHIQDAACLSCVLLAEYSLYWVQAITLVASSVPTAAAALARRDDFARLLRFCGAADLKVAAAAFCVLGKVPASELGLHDCKSAIVATDSALRAAVKATQSDREAMLCDAEAVVFAATTAAWAAQRPDCGRV